MDRPGNRGHYSTRFFFPTIVRQKLPAMIMAVAGVMICTNNVRAEITPRLDLGLYYNDNATLAPSGEEQKAYVTELKPGIRLSRDGPRFDGQLDYTLQALKFSGDINNSDTHHQLSASSTTTFVPGSLFLDGSATYSQQFLTPDGTVSLDNLSDTENRTDVLTYSLSPYIRQQYGSTARAEYRISRQRVDYKHARTVDQTDSSNNSALINLQSGPAFNQLLWQLSYSYNKVNYDREGVDTKLQNTLLALRYRITPKFAALANIGYESNDYERAFGEDPPSGSIWSAGFAWTPSRRTSLDITRGERFFGSTSSLNFTHRTRRTRWSLSYSEDITTTSQLQLRPDVAIDPDTGIPLEPLYRQTTSAILLKRLSFSFSMETGKTTIQSQLYKDRRTNENDNETDEQMGANVNINWRFLPRTSAVLTTTWYETNPLATDRTDHLINAGLSIERRIRPTVTGSVGYGSLRRTSTDESSEYRRNLVSLAVHAEF